MMTYIDRIAALGACRPAVDWLRTEQHPTIEAAWAACPRGDWMLWLHGHVSTSEPWSHERKPLVRAAMECLRGPPAGGWAACVRDHARAYLNGAPDVILDWTRGEATAEQAQQALVALRTAAYTAEQNAHFLIGIQATVSFVGAVVSSAESAAAKTAFAKYCARYAFAHPGIVRAHITCPELP